MHRCCLLGGPRGLPRCCGRASLEPLPPAQLRSRRSWPQEITADDPVTGAEIITSMAGFIPPVLEVSAHV